LYIINLDQLFGLVVNPNQGKNMRVMHILAISAALAFASTLQATPPPEICLSSDSYLTTGSWDLLSASFDLPPPVGSVVLTAIIDTGLDLTCGIIAQINEIQIAQNTNSATFPNRHLLTWSDKGHDTFRRTEAYACVDCRKSAGKLGYFVSTEYRRPLLC
jgi:hypothetical protein